MDAVYSSDRRKSVVLETH